MKLMESVKAALRVKHYNLRTEKTYCYLIRFLIRFHGIRHPAPMAGQEVRQFLEHLAIERHVAAATQNQALNAIVFLYRHVLEQPLGEIGTFSRAKRPQRFSINKVLTIKLRDKSHFLKLGATEFEVLGGCSVMGKSY